MIKFIPKVVRIYEEDRKLVLFLGETISPFIRISFFVGLFMFCGLLNIFIDWGSIPIMIVIGFIVYPLGGKLFLQPLRQITITPSNIAFYYNKYSSKNIEFLYGQKLSINVKLKDDVAILSILSEQFILTKTEDIALITDKVASILELEYYNSSQLSDGTEMLMYKNKAVANSYSKKIFY